MPRRAKQECAEPRCRALTRSSRCPLHQRHARDYDTHRPSAAKRHYGRKWRVRRRVILARDPFCKAPGCNAVSTDVDHIVDVVDGGSDDDDNLQGLCHPCHSRKTARTIIARRLARRRRGGVSTIAAT